MPGTRRAVLAAGYALALLLFFEGSARIALGSRGLFERVMGNDDSSWRLLWLRRADQRALAYSFDAYHPVRGWALKPDLRQPDAFGGKALESNSRGLRGPIEHSYEKPPGVVRILTFGDSFTFGEDVGDRQTWAAELRRLLPGTEVLNFGVHGYGHDQMLLYLNDEGIRYHPDVVILGFVSWDMERNVLGFRDYAKPRFRIGADGLVLENQPVPRPEQILAAERQRSRFADLLVMLSQRLRTATGQESARVERLTRALLDAFAKSVAGAGARLVLAYLPAEAEIRPGPMPAGERFFLDYCRERKAACVDTRGAFVRAGKSGIRLRTEGHWNPREHRLAAEAIQSYLVVRGIVAAPPKPPKAGR